MAARLTRSRHDAPTNLARLRGQLLRWYRREARDLPWRRRRDPYAVWVSEIMLQQTRVETVVPHYERFMARFPTVEALAAASPQQVLRAWTGLGYYSRGRNLHAAARRVRALHEGVVPQQLEVLQSLPGVGRYTAGAIASIAYGKRVPIVDGNVARVFARLFGLDADIELPATRRKLWAWATAWAQSRHPGDANQAVMELGATCCIPARPRCAACPLQRDCTAHRTGRAGLLPRRQPRRTTKTLGLVALLVRRNHELLLVHRRSGRLLRGWWEVPTCVSQTGNGQPVDAQAALQSACGVRAGRLTPAGQVRHFVLDMRLEVQVLSASQARESTPRKRGRPRDVAKRLLPRKAGTPDAPRNTPIANLELEALDFRWVRADPCRKLTVSTLTRKVLRHAARHDSTWADYLSQEERQETTHKRRRNPAENNAS